MPEAVNHPQHYGGEDNPYEHIKVSNAWGLNYELGNATKYICRAGKKTTSALEDLKKARWYIGYEIKKLEAELGIDNPAPLAGPLDRCCKCDRPGVYHYLNRSLVYCDIHAPSLNQLR